MQRSIYWTYALTATWLAAFATTPVAERVRIAQFNIRELTGDKIAQVDDAGRGSNAQLRNAAAILREMNADIVLLNEIDFDEGRRENARLFLTNYVYADASATKDAAFREYPFIYFAPVNTGVPTGHDLDNDGQTDGPADAYGYGEYPGQYGMAVWSRYPIETAAVRTFLMLRWRDMPKNLMPDGTDGKPAHYSAEEAALLRLSSKSHWDVPVCVGDTTIHLLASHPTPPVFDGPEDFNGRHNFDEIRFWADYLTGGEAAAYIVDDAGGRGGLNADAAFVILGDLNADPVIGEAAYGRPAVRQLLDHPKVQDPQPRSRGATTFESRRPYDGDKALRTAEFGRADYVLPSRSFKVLDAGVFWPAKGERGYEWISGAEGASDHHLVWVDLEIADESASGK